MTQRKNTSKTGLVPPTYDGNNRRSNSFNNLALPDNEHATLVMNNMHTMTQMNTCPEHLNTLTNNQPRLVPLISIASSLHDEQNPHHNNHQTKFDKLKLKVYKIGEFFRPPSKSPNSSRHYINDDRSAFKSYLPDQNVRHNDRPFSYGNASGFAKNNAYNHSKSYQEKIEINRYQSNESLKSNSELNDLIINNTMNNRNFNTNVTIINNLPNKRSEKFFYDSETKAEIKKKLDLLPLEERIKLQEYGYLLLKKQVDINSVLLDKVKLDIQEMGSELKDLNEAFKSAFEIEQLKGEIRALTNDKAELELKINKRSPWACKTCTFRNKNDLITCSMCKSERDDLDEIIICTECSTKNPLSNLNCLNCDFYFYSSKLNNQHAQVNNRKSTNSSTTSCSSTTSLSSPIMTSLLYPHSNGLPSTPLSPRYDNNATNFFQ